MAVEAAIVAVGWWLIGKAGSTWFSTLVAKANSVDQRRRLAEKMGEAVDAAISFAARTATSTPDESPRVVFPAGIELRLREFILVCSKASADGKATIPGSSEVIKRDEANSFLEPLQALLLKDVQSDQGSEACSQLAANYHEFARRIPGWADPGDTQKVLGLLVRGFLVAFQREMITRFPDDTEGLVRDRLEQLLRRGVEEIVATLDGGFRTVVEAVSQGIGEPFDCWEGPAHQAARFYANEMINNPERPGAGILRNRLLGLLAGLKDHELPYAERIYVTAGIGAEGLSADQKPPEEIRSSRHLGDRQAHRSDSGPTLAGFLSHRCISLTGGPGSGKSVELWTMATSCAQQLLEAKATAVPIYLRLGRSSPGVRCELEEMFPAGAQRRLLATCMAGVEGARALLFLDSLDEAGQTVAENALKEVAKLLRHPGFSVVVAGRRECSEWWRRHLGMALSCRLELQPFSPEQAQQLCSSFCEALRQHGRSDAKQRLQGARARIAGDSTAKPAAGRQLEELLGIPLYLTIYLVISFQQQEPPQDAAGLMRNCVRQLLSAAMSDRGAGSVVVSKPVVDRVMILLERFAAQRDFLTNGCLYHFDEHRFLDLAEADVSLMNALRRGLKADQRPEQELRFLLLEGTGLFEAYRGEWRFSLFPIQEHFAARGLVRRLSRGEENAAGALVDGLAAARWTEEMGRHVVGTLLKDPEISVKDSASRVALVDAAIERLLRDLDSQAPDLDLTLLLEVRDRLLDEDTEAVELVQGRLLSEEAQSDPVFRQLDETPDVFSSLAWEKERQNIRGQVDAWLAGRDPAALAESFVGTKGVSWKVKDYGPTLAAIRDDEPHWLLVPPGPFLAGSWEKSDETPVRVAQAGPLWMARNPVTVPEYEVFVEEGYGAELEDNWWHPFRVAAFKALDERREPRYWEEQRERQAKLYKPQETGHYPVVGVSWFEAAAYCRWLSLRDTDDQRADLYRLPTEAEWEKASRGLLARRWPWGCIWRDDLAVVGREWELESLATVEENRNVSPFGVRGTAGNVWEWTATRWQDERFGKQVSTDKDFSIVKEVDPISLRGGSFVDGPGVARCACRAGGFAQAWNLNYGFRCIRDVR